MIIINKIEKEFGNKTLFSNLSLSIYDGEHVGVVGKNGSGKSTMLKIIAGELEPDCGVVRNDGKIAFVHQIHEKQVGANDSAERAAFNKIKSKLNVKDAEFEQFDTLSGGEKTKLAIASALAKEPSILLLDEPTNNLDEQGISWLIERLNEFAGTLLVVSHDRYFLDCVANKIVEVENGKVDEYDGNYTQYEMQKRQKLNYEKKQYTKKVQENERIANEISALKQRAQKLEKASRRDGSADKRSSGFKDSVQNKVKKLSKQIQSKKNRLEKLKQNLEDYPEEQKEIYYRVEAEQTHSKLLVKAENLSKSFGEKVLFQNANFEIENGEKIALFGQNGSGKTTLIKMLLGEEPYEGILWKSKNLKVAYLPQNAFDLSTNETILEFASRFVELKTQFLTNLCNMGMKREMFDKKICNLSAGEKMKIKLNELILGDFNFLILDEPTNNLDIENKLFLEKVLSGYKDNLLLVSHDKTLVQNVCNKMLKIEGQTITKMQV